MESKFKRKQKEIVIIEEQNDASEGTILQGSQIFGSLVQTKHLANIIKRSKWINGTIIENHARALPERPLSWGEQNGNIESRRCINYNAWIKGLAVLDDKEKQAIREIENNEYLRRIADGIEELNGKLDDVTKDLDFVVDSLGEDFQMFETFNKEDKEELQQLREVLERKSLDDSEQIKELFKNRGHNKYTKILLMALMRHIIDRD